DQYEIQMLYGMADPLKDAVAKAGHRLRVYVPFGQLIPGMAYLVRRLLENTASQSFLRLGFAEDAPPEELLRSPREAAEGRGGAGEQRGNGATADAHEGGDRSNGAAAREGDVPFGSERGRDGAPSGDGKGMFAPDPERGFINEPVHRFISEEERAGFA